MSDSNVHVGNAYLGCLYCSDLPANMRQADAVVEVLGSENNKVIKVTISSTEVAPYHWEGSY